MGQKGDIKSIWKKHKAEMSARRAACLLASACNDLYVDKPGDDTTVAAIKIREKVKVNVNGMTLQINLSRPSALYLHF